MIRRLRTWWHALLKPTAVMVSTGDGLTHIRIDRGDMRLEYVGTTEGAREWLKQNGLEKRVRL